MKWPIQIEFCKSKIILVKIEHKENISYYLSPTKELRDKLGDIGEKISSNDIIIITLNWMLLEC